MNHSYILSFFMVAWNKMTELYQASYLKKFVHAVQLIVKPHGSSGTADPLDQRATVGAKVAAYAAVILNDLWLVRIEHTVS